MKFLYLCNPLWGNNREAAIKASIGTCGLIQFFGFSDYTRGSLCCGTTLCTQGNPDAACLSGWGLGQWWGDALGCWEDQSGGPDLLWSLRDQEHSWHWCAFESWGLCAAIWAKHPKTLIHHISSWTMAHAPLYRNDVFWFSNFAYTSAGLQFFVIIIMGKAFHVLPECECLHVSAKAKKDAHNAAVVINKNSHRTTLKERDLMVVFQLTAAKEKALLKIGIFLFFLQGCVLRSCFGWRESEWETLCGQVHSQEGTEGKGKQHREWNRSPEKVSIRPSFLPLHFD